MGFYSKKRQSKVTFYCVDLKKGKRLMQILDSAKTEMKNVSLSGIFLSLKEPVINSER